ncbi:hypothetical protein PSQ19_00400 [Devosia algicola]|uniref:Uncharacterized protein n=1 Tax=Devosia algicola TaxID=3026418 RepID=A0ABY7YNU9_9HYPH|nr:hypothetical protein [Devosia algicola]WDR02740.1 hypothetical protein PSQ19_00400 [Devosia algicola]
MAASSLFVGTRLEPLNWLELKGTGPFSLALTLYDTVAASGLSSAEVALPAISKVGCS